MVIRSKHLFVFAFGSFNYYTVYNEIYIKAQFSYLIKLKINQIKMANRETNLKTIRQY